MNALHRRALLVALFLSIVIAARASAADVRPPEQLAHFDDMGKPVVFPDGTIALYFIDIRGPGLAPTPPVQYLRCRLSKDNGHTWGEPQSLFQFPTADGGFGFHTGLVDQSGEVHLFMLCDAGTGVIRERDAKSGRPAVEPLNRQHLDIWHVRSTDQRTKWTPPKKIWDGRAGDLQSAIQLRSGPHNGRLILPFCAITDRTWSNRGEGFYAFTYTGFSDNSALYSDDDGETWTQSKSILRTPTVHNDAVGGVEPVLVQLNDGRVWMLIRTQNGRFYQSFSQDGSEWSPVEPTDILSSDSPAGLVPLPGKRLVLMWNNCLRYPYAQGARNILHAAISDDDGKTWHGRREILRDPLRKDPPPPRGDYGVSYPYPVLAHDGRIVYTMWVETGQGRTVESFDPQWLLETADSDDFSQGLDRWSIFGCKGIEIADHAGSADGKVLSLRRADPVYPCTAVWNFPAAAAGSLKLRLLVEPQSGGATLMLTDHFSVPFDEEDSIYSVYRIALPDPQSQEQGRVQLEPGHWTDLELRWFGDQRRCGVLIDGQPAATIPQSRETTGGPSYLRIRCNARQPQSGHLFVDSVQMAALAPPKPR